MTTETNFEKIAKSRRESSFIGELWTMLREKKKYWLMPIVLVLLLLGVLVFLSGTAAAPFIYTLF
jgi:fluoride ion exporter CrcB/FEX